MTFRGRFGLDRVWLSSGRFRVNQFLVKYALHAKTSNFVENFESGMVRFGSIRISGPLSGEHISSVGSEYGSGSFCSGFGSQVNFARSTVLPPMY